MSVRESFVARFDEEQAQRIEEASIGHVNDDPVNHANDKWGPDPFKYHLLNCISHECLGRWSTYHGITVPEAEVKEWALAEADLYHYEGDIPDYIGALAGAYTSWINWEQAGDTPPEGAAEMDAERERWRRMNSQEKAAEMKQLAQQAMELLNRHLSEGPLGEDKS